MSSIGAPRDTLPPSTDASVTEELTTNMGWPPRSQREALGIRAFAPVGQNHYPVLIVDCSCSGMRLQLRSDIVLPDNAFKLRFELVKDLHLSLQCMVVRSKQLSGVTQQVAGTKEVGVVFSHQQPEASLQAMKRIGELLVQLRLLEERIGLSSEGESFAVSAKNTPITSAIARLESEKFSGTIDFAEFQLHYNRGLAQSVLYPSDSQLYPLSASRLEELRTVILEASAILLSFTDSNSSKSDGLRLSEVLVKL